jgi:hypothetical protein
VTEEKRRLAFPLELSSFDPIEDAEGGREFKRFSLGTLHTELNKFKRESFSFYRKKSERLPPFLAFFFFFLIDLLGLAR